MISGWCIFQTVCIFCLALTSADLIRVGRRGGFSPIFIWYVYHGLNLPIIWFYFIFTRCSTTPRIFAFSGFSSMSNLCIIPRDPLLRVLSRVQIWRFQREIQSGMRNLRVLSMRPDLRIYLDFIVGLPLFSMLPRTFVCYWLAAFLGSSWSYGSFLKRAPKVLEGMIHDGEWCMGKYPPWLLVPLSSEVEGIDVISYLSSYRLTLVADFPLHSTEEEIIKYK